MQKQLEETSKEAVKKVVVEVLPILDNFGRALKSSDENQDFKLLFDGLKITNSQINNFLDHFGVKAIETVGKEFDPNMHEALLMEERDDVDMKNGR